MLIVDQLKNHWIRFKVLYGTVGQDKATLARTAVIYVIENFCASSTRKCALLSEIGVVAPLVFESISDTELQGAFQRFSVEVVRHGGMVAQSELHWINVFVRSPTIRMEMEKIIYRSLLIASSFHDEIRRRTKWTFNESDRVVLVREVLATPNLGSKRKMELAREFGEPHQAYLLEYYFTLLCEGHYDNAIQLIGGKDEVFEAAGVMVIKAIVAKIDARDYPCAMVIARKFRPYDTLVSQIQRIATACGTPITSTR